MQPRLSASATWVLATILLVAACQSHPSGPPESTDPSGLTGLQAFGSMREVMRDGRDEGRVAIAGFDNPTMIGVGALAGLSGEITIADGQVLVATVRNGVATARVANTEDQATLLVAEDVAGWHDYEIGSCESYDELEAKIARLVRSRDDDPTKPTAVRIRGNVTRLQVHVIAGACPIANPTGPSPWRYDGPADNARIVGFYVEGAAGKWTHHNHQSHLHAISDQAMGHLDGLVIENAVVSLPIRR